MPVNLILVFTKVMTPIAGSLLLLAVLAAPIATGYGEPTSEFERWLQESHPYNGKFTFTRIRYGSSGFGGGFRGGGNWAHDYPIADENLPLVMSEISIARPNLRISNVLDLENPAIFFNPILYLSEPGYWGITEEGAKNLREYLLKGGFLIVDDFEDTGGQWQVFERSLRRALPENEYTFVEIGVEHPVFQSFFNLDKLDTPHPLVRVTPIYLAIFEDNDPKQRIMVLVNLNCDLAEYWEWSGRGYFPIDESNDAYKMGINYIFYGMTH